MGNIFNEPIVSVSQPDLPSQIEEPVVEYRKPEIKQESLLQLPPSLEQTQHHKSQSNQAVKGQGNKPSQSKLQAKKANLIIKKNDINTGPKENPTIFSDVDDVDK